MSLIGYNVRNNEFGEGFIVKQDEKEITVCFSNSVEMSYPFPDVFWNGELISPEYWGYDFVRDLLDENVLVDRISQLEHESFANESALKDAVYDLMPKILNIINLMFEGDFSDAKWCLTSEIQIKFSDEIINKEYKYRRFDEQSKEYADENRYDSAFACLRHQLRGLAYNYAELVLDRIKKAKPSGFRNDLINTVYEVSDSGNKMFLMDSLRMSQREDYDKYQKCIDTISSLGELLRRKDNDHSIYEINDVCDEIKAELCKTSYFRDLRVLLKLFLQYYDECHDDKNRERVHIVMKQIYVILNNWDAAADEITDPNGVKKCLSDVEEKAELRADDLRDALESLLLTIEEKTPSNIENNVKSSLEQVNSATEAIQYSPFSTTVLGTYSREDNTVTLYLKAIEEAYGSNPVSVVSVLAHELFHAYHFHKDVSGVLTVNNPKTEIVMESLASCFEFEFDMFHWRSLRQLCNISGKIRQSWEMRDMDCYPYSGAQYIYHDYAFDFNMSIENPEKLYEVLSRCRNEEKIRFERIDRDDTLSKRLSDMFALIPQKSGISADKPKIDCSDPNVFCFVTANSLKHLNDRDTDRFGNLKTALYNLIYDYVDSHPGLTMTLFYSRDLGINPSTFYYYLEKIPTKDFVYSVALELRLSTEKLSELLAMGGWTVNQNDRRERFLMAALQQDVKAELYEINAALEDRGFEKLCSKR